MKVIWFIFSWKVYLIVGFIFVGFGLTCFSTNVIAQSAGFKTGNKNILAEKSSAMPQGTVLRDSGINKLNVFLGTWKAGNDASVDSPSSTVASAEYSCHWSDNKKFLICDQVVTSSTGKVNNLAIYSYDRSNGRYNLSLIGIPGMEPFSIPMTAQNDTLFYNSENTVKGHKTYYRTLNIFNSFNSYTYLVQSSLDKLHWTTSMKGKAVKTSKE